MIREIVKIDEALCDGCGLCIPNCHEGALQLIDGKARLISDLMCDGLGACLGHCPQGAITIEKREAEAYDEAAVMQEMVDKGASTVLAHLRHLQDHQELDFLSEGIEFLKLNRSAIDFDVDEILSEFEHKPAPKPRRTGCPGSASRHFTPLKMSPEAGKMPSALSQWPIQLHLINPHASHFKGSDLLIAADCTAFSLGGFHAQYLAGKTLAIACPKLDQGQDSYLSKIVELVDTAGVNSITVMIMEVPCCGGLLRMVQEALAHSKRKVELKVVIVGIQGEIVSEV